MQTVAQHRGRKAHLSQVVAGPRTVGKWRAADDVVERDRDAAEVRRATDLIRGAQAAQRDVAEDKGLARVEPPGAFDLASQLPGGFARPEAGREAEIALLKAARTQRGTESLVASGIAYLFAGHTPNLVA